MSFFEILVLKVEMLVDNYKTAAKGLNNFGVSVIKVYFFSYFAATKDWFVGGVVTQL